jgi:hypothetical protein
MGEDCMFYLAQSLNKIEHNLDTSAIKANYERYTTQKTHFHLNNARHTELQEYGLSLPDTMLEYGELLITAEAKAAGAKMFLNF